MSQPAAATPANNVNNMPEVVIDQYKFEGKEVQQTAINIAAGGKMEPQAKDPDNRVLSVDDIVTVQLDMKVVGITYAVDNKGILTRVQRLAPIEGVAQIMDVARA